MLQLLYLIVQMLVISTATAVLINLDPYVKFVKILEIIIGRKLQKPLLCATCLPIWITALVLLSSGAHPLLAIPLALCAGFVGNEVDKQMNKMF